MLGSCVLVSSNHIKLCVFYWFFMYLKAVIEDQVEDIKFAKKKVKKNTFSVLFQHVPRWQLNRNSIHLNRSSKLTISSIEVLKQAWSIKHRRSAKINYAKKPITYSFKTRIEIHLNRYLKDIISHLLRGFWERERERLCLYY